MATYLAQLASRDSETLSEISGDRARHARIGGQLAPAAGYDNGTVARDVIESLDSHVGHDGSDTATMLKSRA
jgi:hypothetical protein